MNGTRYGATAALLPLVLCLGIACGDDDGTGASAGSGGSGASGGGGSPPLGGADSGGGGANTGGDPNGGNGTGGRAEGGSGGVSEGGNGEGGASPAEPAECQEDGDCYLSDGCCECAGRPDGELPPPCNQLCIINVCASLQIAGPAQCVAGRCVAPASCDDGSVTCDVPTPECQPGEAPIVDGNCYTGGCLASVECTEVTSCDNCGGAPKTACVQNVAQLPSTHCVTVGGCDEIDCECLGPSVCLEPFDVCSETPDGLDCSCPTCLF